ncbi:MAG: hypothetical protein KDE58_12960 [Caldilineaceae bacterium]|nr:hypothetical protein [Caldilineaceae bacterium]
MGVATITIQVDDQAAQVYESTSEDKRVRLRRLISFLVQEFAESTPESLLTLMDGMSREAEAKGLTPEILEMLLEDE